MGQGSAGWWLSEAHREFEEADETLELAVQLVLAGLEDMEALAVGLREKAEDLRPRGGVFKEGPKLLEFLEETGFRYRVRLSLPPGKQKGKELVPAPAAGGPSRVGQFRSHFFADAPARLSCPRGIGWLVVHGVSLLAE